MKYTKDEEEKAERSSVKMWPGITAGIIIGLSRVRIELRRLASRVRLMRHQPLAELGRSRVRGRHDPPVHMGHVGFKKGHIRGSAYPWVGLVLFSGFSITGNALHAMINTGFRLRHGCRRSS